MDFTEYFSLELKDQSTNFFILDSKGDASKGDIDFIKYSWETTKYNKVKSSDLVIFRRPGSASETNKFYFYGAAKIGLISGDKIVTANLLKPYPFTEHIHMVDLTNFEWSFKTRGETWEHFFNQYGMNQIHRSDFERLMEMADGDAESIEPDAATEAHQDIQKGNFTVEDKEGKTKLRVKQNVFSNKVKDQYKVTCAVCGLKTRSLLIGSHIVPWAANKEVRLDPANGVCFCILHDKLFDLGYFTLSDNLKIQISNKLNGDDILYNQLIEINGKQIKSPTVNIPKPEYLEFHRKNVFEKFIK